MTVLLVSGLAALAAVNAFWWWVWERQQKARIRRLMAERDSAERWRDFWHEQASATVAALGDAAAKAASLKARNRLLTDLVGGGEPE